MGSGSPGVGSAELGQGGGGLTKSQLGLPLFLIRLTRLGGWLLVDQQQSVGVRIVLVGAGIRCWGPNGG